MLGASSRAWPRSAEPKMLCIFWVRARRNVPKENTYRLVGVFFWSDFTTKLEPISRAEAQPRRLAGKPARCAPPEKPAFDSFLRFPPRRISF